MIGFNSASVFISFWNKITSKLVFYGSVYSVMIYQSVEKGSCSIRLTQQLRSGISLNAFDYYENLWAWKVVHLFCFYEDESVDGMDS